MSLFRGHRAGVTALAAGDGSRDGVLFSGSDDGSCRLWDVRSQKSVNGIAGHSGEITAVGFAGEHNLVAACDANLCIYDQRTLRLVAQAANTGTAVKNIYGEAEIQALSTRGDFVAYVDEDGRLGVSDITDPDGSTRFADSHEALAACVCFHPDEPVIATGGFDQQVRVWDVATETVSMTACAEVDDDPSSTRLVNPPFVYALDFAPNAECTVVSGHADGRLMCSSSEGTMCWMGCHDYSISAL
ncbi:hypothetical protein LPJ61_000973 [Coemansia biformis]|uniref:WD40 repeat-like protein n=1 Tax=Coemansia biformis TaxID=1286918 RepID=A0A9W7YHN1_9FUNG|nr:hypothetical protein LPJ61_000973 [Coemansia biformis]